MSLLPKPARTLGIFSLLMIAVISVDSIRNLPINAQYGTSLITFYLIAAIGFFIPLLCITGNLATRYPNTGGSYLWVQTAFGPRWGFVSIWLQWVYNMIWYPTIFAFISTILASVISPSLEGSKPFILLASLCLYWTMTGLSCLGIRAVSWVSTVCAILGTLLPMILIIGLAAYWLYQGNPSAVNLTWQALIPSQHNIANLAFFANILFSLLGIDVIAVHAGDAKNPTRNYPWALALGGIVIISTLVLSTLALCIVVAPEKIGLMSGLIDSFKLFFNQYHVSWGVPFIGLAIIIGSLGVASSWMISLARSLHIASYTSNLPRVMQRANRHNMPHVILITQAVIFTLLLSSYLIFPNINTSYWMLSAMTAHFALFYYILLFSAAFRLLKQEGKSTVWLAVPILAGITSFTGVIAGFLPPSSTVNAHGILRYEFTLCLGIITFFIPLIFFLRRKPRAIEE
jgi:amino acid transporter